MGLPRDPLMLSQRLRLMLLSSTELTDMVDMVLDMLDTDMELTHMPLDTPMVVTHMPMVPTTERDLLMPSQRLRLMLLSSTELMDMVDTVLDMPDTDMELTHMPLDMPMVVTPERDLLAEPEADAAYLYGAYGYGGYGLGYRSYGYGYPYAYGGYGYPYAYGK